jgi:selenoprotein W-related protein
LQPTLIKSRGGVFEVTLDGELLFSKKKAGRFPESGEIARSLASRVPATG